jgi:hypothetical protein
MFKTFILILTPILLTGLFTSCGSAPEKEAPTSKPIKQTEVKKTPSSALDINPTSKFRMLKDDTALPTEAQLADGAETSLGAQPQSTPTDTQPNAAIKPPPSEPEDQLNPSE